MTNLIPSIRELLTERLHGDDLADAFLAMLPHWCPDNAAGVEIVDLLLAEVAADVSAQLAAMAVEELPRFQSEAKERMGDGGRQSGRVRRSEGKELVSDLPESGQARERAAKAFGTNAKYVESAAQIKRDAPDLFEKGSQ